MYCVLNVVFEDASESPCEDVGGSPAYAGSQLDRQIRIILSITFMSFPLLAQNPLNVYVRSSSGRHRDHVKVVPSSERKHAGIPAWFTEHPRGSGKDVARRV